MPGADTPGIIATGALHQMAYQALYRKYRPSTFEEVCSQKAVVETLKNQLKSGRTGHAYLFCGTRGTGKTSVAKIFARAVNCEDPKDGNPCGECPTCRAIASGSAMNVQEIDAASNNGVDNIREIIQDTTFTPAQGKKKVYIIDEVHMLSTGAFNALLKTLEEPPEYVVFILATTEVHKIPLTILSRCQRYDFKRIPVDVITGRLSDLMAKEGLEAEEKALRYIAKCADGAMRDALSLLDQCLAFHYGEKLTYEMVLDVLGAVDTEVFSGLLRNILKGDVVGCVGILNDMVMEGRDLVQLTTDFNWYLRNLLLLKVSDRAEEIIDLSAENLARMREETSLTEERVITRYIRILSELTGKLRQTSQKRVMVELTLIKMCIPEMEKDEDSLADRVRKLEAAVAEGVRIAPSQQASGQTASAAPAAPVKKAPLPAAVPEEIEQVVKNWGAIVAPVPDPHREGLRNAVVSLADNGHLLLVYSSEIKYDMIAKRPEIVTDAIADYLGKKVEVDFRLEKDRATAVASYPDLRSLIHVDEIEMEPDDDDGTTDF